MKTRRRKKTAPVLEKIFTVEVEDFDTVCHVCEAEFLDEDDLKLHIAQVHLNTPYGKTICKICCAVLTGADEYVSHFVFNHLDKCSFCFYCYRVFSEPSLLDQHEMKHCAVEDSAVTCSQCRTILTDRQELQKHEYHEHASSDDGFMLNSLFSLLSCVLNVKIKTFLDSVCKNKAFSCCTCKYSSSNVTEYVEHLKALQCRCFACDKCFNVYKKKSSIITHMLIKPHCQVIVTKKETEKQCVKCDKSFNMKDLDIHQKSCNVIKCSHCEQRFESIDELADHRTQEHNVRISLETCKFCKKQFVGMFSLKKHMSRSHKNKSLYKYHCVHCDSMFIHPSKLFAHFFTQHKEIKPYTCKICNECFRLRKHFTIHIKLKHLGVGFVEFDKDLHVIFTDKKSENPIALPDMDSSTDASDSDCNDAPAKRPRTRSTKQPENKKNVSTEPDIKADNFNTTETTGSPDTNKDSDKNTINVNNERLSPIGTVEIEIERLDESSRIEEERKPITKSKTKEKHISPEVSDSSEEEPLSNVRQSLLRQKTQMPNLKRRMAIRDKRAKLTCKTCNKYCYTVQNFHHHMTLHEKTKMKRCIKCNKYFKSKKELEEHTASTHTSSKLIETLKYVLEKRKKTHPVKPSEPFKSVLERRKKQHLTMAQNKATNKFRKTIRKVNFIDDCTATITPISDHGLSVKNFIENFKPEGDGVSISNSVTLKAVTTPVNKEPFIKMHTFNPETPLYTENKLRFPVKFKDAPVSYMDTKITVNLVQQLVTKPSAVNMSYSERIPLVQKGETGDYCNMFADDTDYTQYKSESIPEVAQEVMLEDLEDIPRTRRLVQEIIIPKISEEHGGVRIGHLLPQAPFFKIVKVKNLVNSASDQETEANPEKYVKLPDGTKLISVKNPYAHLIPNEHLQAILKANKVKYYTPKTKNIEKAIAKALNEVKPLRKRGRKKKVVKEESDAHT